ncbi:MAG: helix-turn-helix transcriptional regulator [Verrucomicrobia bacterium]|nr:helix-turn-helix transcriptional regulator [Verrucomicrobiota bacterium]
MRYDLEDARMAQEHSPKTIPLKVRRWKTDDVFLMLKDPFRQQILRSLANGEAKTGMELNAASGRTRHTYLKHLTALCKVGLLVKKENQNDRRLLLYGLAPGVSVCNTDDGMTMDFGCCMLRFAQLK